MKNLKCSKCGKDLDSYKAVHANPAICAEGVKQVITCSTCAAVLELEMNAIVCSPPTSVQAVMFCSDSAAIKIREANEEICKIRERQLESEIPKKRNWIQKILRLA